MIQITYRNVKWSSQYEHSSKRPKITKLVS